MVAQFDLLIVGDDFAGMCAAACAARRGVKVALVRDLEGAARRVIQLNTEGIPDFVWRRLDLHKFDLGFEPVSARVTLMENGQALTTGRSESETIRHLSDAGLEDVDVWRDFLRDALSVGRMGEALSMRLSLGARAAHEDDLAVDTDQASALTLAHQLASSCTSFLDDYLEDDALKVHVGAHALGGTGLGGNEPGSAIALADSLTPTAWPMRPKGDGDKFTQTLRKICEDADVAFFDGPVVDIEPVGGGKCLVDLEGEELFRVRHVFFPTPDAARRAGFATARPGLRTARDCVQAGMRIKLANPIDPPSGDENALFCVAGSLDELQRARDEAATGALPQTLPLEFEFIGNQEIIIRTRYCPAFFIEDGEKREWSSQDRQSLSSRIIKRLGEHMPKLSENISRSDVYIDEAWPPMEKLSVPSNAQNVVVQPSNLNTINAAVNLIDRLFHDK